MITQQQFLIAYKQALIELYPWTSDSHKLQRYMDGVERSITTNSTIWTVDPKSPALNKVWNSLDLKGPLTIKTLRKLPNA